MAGTGAMISVPGRDGAGRDGIFRRGTGRQLFFLFYVGGRCGVFFFRLVGIVLFLFKGRDAAMLLPKQLLRRDGRESPPTRQAKASREQPSRQPFLYYVCIPPIIPVV